MTNNNQKQIPEGWTETSLGEIAIINPKETLIKNKFYKSVPMANLIEFTRKISSYEIKEFKGGCKFRNGDTLLARITPCLENGKTSYVNILEDNEIAFGSTEYIVIREKENISDKHFLFYLSVSPNFRDIAIKTMTGTSGRQRVQTDALITKKILLPPLPEQKAIAGVLSAFDDKIELLREQNQTLEQTAQTIFKQKFGKYQIGDDLPGGWRVGKIGDIVKLLSGFSFKSKDFDSNGKYKLVTIRNVQDGKFIKETKDRLEDIPEKMPSYCNLKSGDILLSLTGNVGRICQVVGENYLLNQRVAKISPINKINYAFSYLLFRDKNIFNIMENISSGTAQQNLSPIQTANIEIIIPPSEELEAFADFANPIFEKILKNKEQIESLAKNRDTLLPKLMSGEVRVK